MAVHRLSYGHSPGSDKYSMILDGVKYADRDAFTAAVANLPPHSRLVWHSGCIAFKEIPLDPSPRLSISEFQTFCRNHSIHFDYYCGLAEDPLITRTFSAPVPAPRIDARQWLETQGVFFASGSSAHWTPSGQHLKVRNTEHQLELISRILALMTSK